MAYAPPTTLAAPTPTAGINFKTLLLSYHPVIAIDTVEEDRVEGLLRSVGTELGAPVMEWSVTTGLKREGAGGAVYGTGDPAQVLAHIAQAGISAVYWLKDFTPHLTTPEVVRQLKELAETLSGAKGVMSVILSGAAIALPEDLMPVATYYELPLPTPAEYRQVIDWVVESVSWRSGRRVDTSGLDVNAVIRALGGMTLTQARQAVAYVALADGRLATDDVPAIVKMKSSMIGDGGLLEYTPPEENAHELGGFANLKGWLDTARMGFSPQAEALNLSPPKGVLIVGVQGCGKSLAARVIARQWGLPLLKLDAGRLYDGLIGQSEKNFRRVTALAEAMAPDVLWIDEIEKGFAPSRGDADAGLSQRIFGAFLTWLQEKRKEVFVVATANDLTKLPPELQRKGRFDEVFFADLPTAAERQEIWAIQLRTRRQDARHFDVPALAAASDGFTGAEIEQCVISACYSSLRHDGPLQTELLLTAIKGTVPLSVSRRADVEVLRAQAGDFVNVS